MYTINLLTIQFSLWYSPPTEALKFKREKNDKWKKKNKQTNKEDMLLTDLHAWWNFSPKS